MWDLSGSGIERGSPTLSGRLFTTEPPGKLTWTFLTHLQIPRVSGVCLDYVRFFFQVRVKEMVCKKLGQFCQNCGFISIVLFFL